jgi:hypothetical protein
VGTPHAGVDERRRQNRDSIPELPNQRWGIDERIEGLLGKLIFFLTIDNSPALNGPVAIQVKTGESMQLNASVSDRPLPSQRPASVRGLRGNFVAHGLLNTGE